MKVKLHDIEWDTEIDGEIIEVDLPSEMILEVEAEPGEEEHIIHDEALDKASDETGWCIRSCLITIL